MRTEGSPNDPEDRPFPRMVDMWFPALSIAVKEQLKPEMEPTGKTCIAIERVGFGRDAWRSNALMLLAVAHTGGVEITSEPNEMMRLANGFAIAG